MRRVITLAVGIVLAISLAGAEGGCPVQDDPPVDQRRHTNPGVASRTEITATVDGLNLYAVGQMKPGTWTVYPTDPTKCTFGWLDEATGSNQEFGPFRSDQVSIGFTLPPGANIGFHMMKECDHARLEG